MIPTNFRRIQIKKSAIAGKTPTIPTTEPSEIEDFNNLTDTDLLMGEFYLNIKDDKLWVRSENGIIELTSNSNTSINDLTNVNITAVKSDDILSYDGTNWVNNTSLDTRRINTTSITTNLSMVNTNQFVLIAADGLSVTLPDPDVSNGLKYTIKNGDTFGGTTIEPFNTENIDGSTNSLSLTNTNESVTLISDGTNWWTI